MSLAARRSGGFCTKTIVKATSRPIYGDAGTAETLAAQREPALYCPAQSKALLLEKAPKISLEASHYCG